MKKKIIVTFEIDETTLKSFNNALAAYGDICSSLIIGTEIPKKFEVLKQKTNEEIEADFVSVAELYKKIEAEFNKDL